MRCPKCDARTRVRDVRVRGDGMARRHECPACGIRFTTLEIPMTAYAKLSAASNERRVRPADRAAVLRAIEQLQALIQ